MEERRAITTKLGFARTNSSLESGQNRVKELNQEIRDLQRKISFMK
jgi:hypothetical protein